MGALLVAFTAPAVVALALGRTVQCGCFGRDNGVLGPPPSSGAPSLAVPAGVSAWPVASGAASLDWLATTTVVGTLALGSVVAGRWLLATPTLARLMQERRLSTADADRPVG